MSQPHVAASGKRTLTKEKRDRESRSLHPGPGERSSAGKKNAAAFRKAAKETLIRCQEVPEREHLNAEHINALEMSVGVTRGPDEVGPPCPFSSAGSGTTLLSPYLFSMFAESRKGHLVLSTQQTSLNEAWKNNMFIVVCFLQRSWP